MLERWFGNVLISIHALCEEGDDEFEDQLDSIAEFLSTPSARRATRQIFTACEGHQISIHALCEEGDMGCTLNTGRTI